jgi:hypothetical protein
MFDATKVAEKYYRMITIFLQACEFSSPSNKILVYDTRKIPTNRDCPPPFICLTLQRIFDNILL